MREKDFQQQVINLARYLGWEFMYHTFDSRHSPAGFPDLILLKEGRLVVIELKRDAKGQPTPEQYFWLCAFKQITEDVYFWCPDDWDNIIEIIK